MIKMFFFFFIFIITIIGITCIITYLNLLTMGFTFKEYIEFILSRNECIIGILGIFIIITTILIKGDIAYDLYL